MLLTIAGFQVLIHDRSVDVRVLSAWVSASLQNQLRSTANTWSFKLYNALSSRMVRSRIRIAWIDLVCPCVISLRRRQYVMNQSHMCAMIALVHDSPLFMMDFLFVLVKYSFWTMAHDLDKRPWMT